MKLALLGDIALFGNLSIRNNKKIFDYFCDVSQFLSKYDLVVGNLETPFSREKRTFGAKSAYISSDIENIEILKYLHINAVSLANNHMFDYGKEGYETTKYILNQNNIKYFGSEGHSFLYNNNGCKIAFEGFCCYSSNPLMNVPYGKYGVNELEVDVVKKRLLSNHLSGYLNIFSMHGGIEHVNFPSSDHVKLARILSDVCPYVYYGHHPHVVQGIEKINHSILAYSLGNFCFDDVYTSQSDKPLIKLSENNRRSFILEIEIMSNTIISYNTIPLYIGKDKISVGSDVDNYIVDQYNAVLRNIDSEDYDLQRNNLIQSYLKDRKSKRDLRWYMKRIRIRYVKLLLAGYRNNKKYKNLLIKKIMK